MDQVAEVIKGLAPFDGLDDGEVTEIARIVEQQNVKAGEAVFKEGDPGDTLYIVQSGLVKITTVISEGVEKTLIEVRDGGVFGELALLDTEFRSACAIADRDTQLVLLQREALTAIADAHPALGVKIFGSLCRTVTQRLRDTTEALRQNLRWGLEVSGSLDLNFHRLLTDSVELTVTLVSGKQLCGALLKVEQSAAGHELWLKCADDKLALVPYHAVTSISLGAHLLSEAEAEAEAEADEQYLRETPPPDDVRELEI